MNCFRESYRFLLFLFALYNCNLLAMIKRTTVPYFLGWKVGMVAEPWTQWVPGQPGPDFHQGIIDKLPAQQQVINQKTLQQQEFMQPVYVPYYQPKLYLLDQLKQQYQQQEQQQQQQQQQKSSKSSEKKSEKSYNASSKKKSVWEEFFDTHFKLSNLRKLIYVEIILYIFFEIKLHPEWISTAIVKLQEQESHQEGTIAYEVKMIIDKRDWKRLQKFMDKLQEELQLRVNNMLTEQEKLLLATRSESFALRLKVLLIIRPLLIKMMKFVIFYNCMADTNKDEEASMYLTMIIDKIALDHRKPGFICGNLLKAIDLQNKEIFDFYINQAFTESEEEKKRIAKLSLYTILNNEKMTTKFGQTFTDNQREEIINRLVNLGATKTTDDAIVRKLIEKVLPSIKSAFLQEKLKRYAQLPK